MGIIRLILFLGSVLVLVDGIIHFFIPKMRNQYKWAKTLKSWTDFVLNPIRKLIGGDMPYDLSYPIFIGAVVLIVVLW